VKYGRILFQILFGKKTIIILRPKGDKLSVNVFCTCSCTLFCCEIQNCRCYNYYETTKIV